MRTSVYAQYQWAISKLGLDGYFTAHTSPMELVYKPTGQKILFFGADDADKLKSIKLPFGYIGITHFEEKDQFSGRAEIRTILQSTMRGGDKFWNFESYNPPISASNWANMDSLEERPDRYCHKSCYLDVPPEWLGEQFFIEADILKSQNYRAYEHEYLGVPTGTGGSVFENVTVRNITEEERKSFDRIYMGIDWGWFPDPFAWVKMHYDSNRRKLYIFDEYRCNKRGNRETADYLMQHKGVQSSDMIIADSAEPKSIGDYRSYGLSCRPVEKGAGSVDYSMKWLQSLDEIIIDKSCEGTAAEFLQYEYERTKNDEIISGYPDRNNHSIDAVRYGMFPMWRKRGR
jgi:PBSX family phage terminase large subunit